MHGAYGAWVSEADVCTLEIFNGQFVCAHFANDFVVCKQETCEVERIGIAQHRHNKCALTLALIDIDCKADVDIVMALNLRLTVCISEVTVLHVGNSIGNCAHYRITNDVRETDFRLTCARAVIVHYLAIHF